MYYTHRDVTDLINHVMVKNKKTWISWKRTEIFLRNKKIPNLCFRWNNLKSYRFVAEVTFNKKDTSKTKVNCCSTLCWVWTNVTPCLSAFMIVFEKQVNTQCGIGSISMLISSHIHNAANCAIAKNSGQSYFKRFEVFFSRKQQGAIRTDWKIYSCIFYHLCIMVTIFQVANSLSIFQQQYLLWHNTENRWKVIIYNHVK